MHFCGQIVNFVTSFAIVNLDTLNLKTKKEKLKPCNRNRKRTKKNCIFYGTSQFQDFWSPITFFLHNVVSSNFLRRYEYTERKIFYNFLNTFSLDHNLNFFLDHPVGCFFLILVLMIWLYFSHFLAYLRLDGDFSTLYIGRFLKCQNFIIGQI